MDLTDTPGAADLPEPHLPPGDGYACVGAGSTTVAAAPEAIWAIVMDETRLAAVVPGAGSLHRVADPADHTFAERADDRAYAADVVMGVGPLKATYLVEVALKERTEPRFIRLEGGAKGPFGNSAGEGYVRFTPVAEGTRVDYRYAVLITGRVATLGGRLVDGLARSLIDRFFHLLSADALRTAGGAADDAPDGSSRRGRGGLWGRVSGAFSGGDRK